MEETCPAFTMPSCPWKHNSPRPPVSVSDERTRSFLDVSDSTRRILQQGRGRCSSLSVKELSARYLSQAAAAAAHGGPTQPTTVKDSSTPSSDRQKTSKPLLKEVCASCLQPVYSVERVVTDKVCLHHSCFCCRVCGKKLSLQNYAALRGVFYCQVHYKQMAGAENRSEARRLEQQLRDHQVQRAAAVGREAQPQGWYNRAENKTEGRRKPTSFNAQGSLQLAEQRRELNSRPVLLGNKLRTSWPPSETALLAGDGKDGNFSWKKPTLSLQTGRAAGNEESRMVLGVQKGRTAVEAAVKKGSFLPGVTYPEKRQQECSWPKPGEQRDGEKKLAFGDGDVPRGKRGGTVSQRVSAFQQGRVQLQRGSVSASSPMLLEPVKSVTHQSTKPTNWRYLGTKGGCSLPTAGLPVKENEARGSLLPLSTSNEGGTTPAVTADKLEQTTATPNTAGGKHHLGERMSSPQPVCVPGEPETRNITNMEPKYRAEGDDAPEYKAEDQAFCLSGVPGSPSVASSSLEPEGLSASPQIAELVHEKSKTNVDEFPGKQTPVSLEEYMLLSSVSHLPEVESKGVEFEKTKETKPSSTLGFLEEPSPEHTFLEETPEKNRAPSPGLPEKTDDPDVPRLQETEPQATCNPLMDNPHGDILVHDVKSPGKDFPVSADMPLKGTCATWPSPDEADNSKSKDPSEVLDGNTFNISEQPVKKFDSSKLSESSDKHGGHREGEEKMELKHPGESTVHTSRSGDQSKETRSSQARTEVLGKGLRLGKNPFTMLFGSEDKGSTPKKETSQRKPTKPQSALVTLFGYSSEKKQSQQEKPARSSEQTDAENKQEKPQGLFSSSSQAKQKASKNDQLPQPGKTEVIPKDKQESSGGCSDTTEGKETNILLFPTGTNISCDDKHKGTELEICDQPASDRQVQQLQESCWPSLVPAQENQKEGAADFEGGTNPFHPPPELTPAADTSKKLTREGSRRDVHLLEIQNLPSLDIQDTKVEDGIFSSSSNLRKLPEEAELQLDNMDLLEDSNVLLTVENKGQDFPGMASKIPNLGLQNSPTGTSPCFDPNPSELCQEILASAPLEPWDPSSFPFLVGQDKIVTGGSEGIQGCALLQHFDPQYQAPKAAEDAFGWGCSAEGSPNKHLSVQEGSFPPLYMITSHASENPNQGLFDPFHIDSDQIGQDVPAEMDGSRKISGAEEAHESLCSADPDAFSNDPLNQEFFI
uniref:Xin actin binding repeat containing 1 n=1 Tax=Anas zonorhyncha TaxID=75864 RepID=A0A8B9V8E8_9AVES